VPGDKGEMSDWVNEFPFAWLLIAVLALCYIAATAIYTRVMMLVVDRRGRIPTTIVPSDTRVVDRPSSQKIATAVGGSASTGSSCAPETGWKRLTSEDVDRVKRALSARRAEALARHADELQKLEAERAQIEAVERAINSFTRKYRLPQGTTHRE
jgi:predicted DNA-binding protein (UPF0278 family)